MSKNRFGYCCINLTLRKNESIQTNRTMRRKTFDAKGLGYTSSLAFDNTRDLLRILEWNAENGFEVFRVTSTLFPWASEYQWEELPNFEAIKDNLQAAGKIAQSTGQRLSFHPGPFNCLASPNKQIVDNCIRDLSIHGDIMDMMGMPRNHFAKINIHIGASYGDRETALNTWCRNFEKLPENVRTRLTVENDDRPNLYSTKMLYDSVYKRLDVPVVFDSHHHACGRPCRRPAAARAARRAVRALSKGALASLVERLVQLPDATVRCGVRWLRRPASTFLDNF